MKRCLSLFLVLTMLITISACGGTADEPTATPATVLTTAPATIPTTDPTTESPTTESPTMESPTTESPTTESPTTEPPTTESPTTEPPATNPPATNPPATNPPTTNPPTTEPPATNGSTYTCVCSFTCECENINGIIGYCPHFVEHYEKSPTCCNHPASFYMTGLFDKESHYDLCGLCNTKFVTSTHTWVVVPEKSIKSDCNPNVFSYEHIECPDCGMNYLNYLGEGHDFGDRVLISAGCKNSGPRYERTCKRCGIIEQTVDENGKQGACYSNTVNPCIHDSYCESCGEKISDKLGHTGGAATCTCGPICMRCGWVYGDTLGGHRGGVATCTSGAICDTCGTEYTEALGHRNTYVTGQVEPTCCNGYTGDTHCSDCGEVISGSTIPSAYEHAWVEISRTQTATEWTVVSQCSNCGSTSTVSIKIG